MRIDRRTLLVGGGAAGLLVAYAAWPRAARPLLRPDKGEALLGPGIAIGADGKVSIAVPQVETGQGIWTGLAQIAADELGAAWERVSVVPALSSAGFGNALAAGEGWLEGLGSWKRWRLDDDDLRLTLGSTSVRAMAEPMRQVAAAARTLLIAEAADRWGVSEAECDTGEGAVTHEGKSLPFGALAEATARRRPPSELRRRSGRGKLIGKPLPRLDAVPKANGSMRFAADVRLAGMKYASVRRGTGIRLSGNMPRGVRLVETEGWVATIADDWWSAEQALEAAAPRGRGFAGGDDGAIGEALEAAYRGGEAVTLQERGDVEAAFAGARPLVADYSARAALHADLESASATARWSDGTLEVWAGTQAPELTRVAAAEAAGVSLARTTLYPMPVGGQDGRALKSEMGAIAAALAAKTGHPVQATLSRTEQVRGDAVRPPLRARMMARPLADGSIAAWQMRVAGSDGTAAALQRLLGGEAAFREGSAPALPYSIPNVRVEAVKAQLPLTLGYHRGELLGPLTFFAESFFDELALIGGRDPLGSRMAMLGGNPRVAACLARATALGGWDGGGAGSQMGIGCASVLGSHIALIATAAPGPDGRVAVSRMVAAIDVGEVINPSLVQQQIEGGLIAALAKDTGSPPSFMHGRVFGPVTPNAPGLRGQPEILVEILPSRAAPGGVNGLASAVASAAVGNALAAATGRRLRTLPLNPMS